MAGKKYRDDYRLTERVDARGRIRQEAEYVGAEYRWRLEPGIVLRERRRALAACAVGAAAYIGALLPRSAASHEFYIALPFVFAALPLGLILGLLLSLPGGGAPLRRRTADRLANRYPGSAVFIVVLSAASLLGEGIWALRGGELSAGDAVFCVCAAVLAAAGVYLLKKRRSFDTREIETVSSIPSAF